MRSRIKARQIAARHLTQILREFLTDDYERLFRCDQGYRPERYRCERRVPLNVDSVSGIVDSVANARVTARCGYNSGNGYQHHHYTLRNDAQHPNYPYISMLSLPPEPHGYNISETLLRCARRTATPMIPRTEIGAFLASLSDYVILRNHDVWANFERGGDLDILVHNIETAEELLCDSLGPPLWFTRRSYVSRYFYPWGNIDLLPSIDWNGVEYLPTKCILDHSRTSALGFKQPRLSHEAIISWFASLLWGGFFKKRYADTIIEAARTDEENFKQALSHAVGQKWAKRLLAVATSGQSQVSEQWAKALRRAVLWQAMKRNPKKTIFGWCRYLFIEVSLRLRPPVPWVAVLGPDGSGKSTLLSTLRTNLRGYFPGIIVCHLRPYKILHKILPGPDGRPAPVLDPHGKPPRGFLLSMAKLSIGLIDWFCGYWTYLIHLRAKGFLVLFDRHFIDIFVDPRRYRYGGPMWAARCISFMIPRPGIWIFLDVAPDIVQNRKREVTADETVRQRQAYLELAKTLRNAHIVDAGRSCKDVAQDVEQIIVSHIAKHSMPCKQRRSESHAARQIE